jgi:hypothetical protein
VKGVATGIGLIAALLGYPSVAHGQSAKPPRVELGAGVIWDGHQALGARAATETTSSGSTLALFNSSSDLASAAGFEGRLGVRVTRSLVLEAATTYVKPELRIALSGDSENAAPVTATETIQQFTIGGSVLWYVPGPPRRFAPFAIAGGGYLRQLHAAATLVDTGRYYQFGGGVSALLTGPGHLHTAGIGVRADVRALVRSRGVAFDGGTATSPAAGLSAFVRF